MCLCLDSWVCMELGYMSSLNNFCHASCSTQLNILGPFVECCYCSDHWMIYLKLEETAHCKLSHRMSTNVPKHQVYINFILHTRSLLFKRRKKNQTPLLMRADMQMLLVKESFLHFGLFNSILCTNVVS